MILALFLLANLNILSQIPEIIFLSSEKYS